MAKTSTDVRAKPETKRDLVAEFDALQARIREQNPDMTEADWEALAELWAEAVNARIRERVEQMRRSESLN